MAVKGGRGYYPSHEAGPPPTRKLHDLELSPAAEGNRRDRALQAAFLVKECRQQRLWAVLAVT